MNPYEDNQNKLQKMTVDAEDSHQVLTAADVTISGDHLVRATARGGHVKLAALRAEGTVSKLVAIHDLSPLMAAAAGRMAMATQLLAADLKDETSTITSILRCNGPVQGMTMVADCHSRVRGVVKNPHVSTAEIRPGKLAVGAAVGKGELTVIKDLGLREPYVGTVELLTGEIAEDFAYYLLTSEQIPGVLALGVKMNDRGVSYAGGLLVQLMPGHTEEDLEYIEKRAGGGFPEITFLLEEGFSPAQIIDLFMGDPELTYLDCRPISYHCPCNQARMERNLLALGRSELQSLAADPAGIELCCHFCGKKYHFAQAEISGLLSR